MKALRFCLLLALFWPPSPFAAAAPPASAPAASVPPIRIAAIVAQTGVAVEATMSSLRAVQLAADAINADGGLLGRPVTLLVFDNASTPIGSRIAAEKAADAGVVGIIGSQWSSHSLAVARVAQARSIPMITNISTNPNVTRVGDFIFRVCYTDPFQGRILARFAREDLKAETAAVMVDLLSDYSMDLAETFTDHFARLGGRIVSQIKYKQTQEDYTDLIRPLSNAPPDVIFLSGHSESGLIIKQAISQGLNDRIFLGGDGWDDTVFFQNGGNLLREGYFTTHWSREVDTPASRRFLERYPEYNDSAALALAHDAAMLLADAIRRAGDTAPEKVREALAATRNFSGITGSITMDENGDPVKPAVIRRISNGRESFLKLVAP